MLRKTFLTAALSVAAVVSAGAAQARDADVSWSVTIASPGTAGVYGPAPRVREVVRVVPVHGRAPAHPRADADRDGIPNHRDRLYNPAWDVDGDGIPNRYDRRYNPPHDRDGDGIPSRWDSRPGVPRPGIHYGRPAYDGRGR